MRPSYLLPQSSTQLFPTSPPPKLTIHTHTHTHPLLSPAGVGIRDLAGDAFDFLRKSSSLIQVCAPTSS